MGVLHRIVDLVFYLLASGTFLLIDSMMDVWFWTHRNTVVQLPPLPGDATTGESQATPTSP